MVCQSQRMLVVVMLAGFAAATVAFAEQQAPRKLVAPVRGEAAVEYTKPNTKIVKGEVVTVLRVKNVSDAPIAGLKIDENWYDKGGNPVGGATYRHRRPLAPNDVIEVELRSPRNPQMNSNQYLFSHANGNVKPKMVPKLDLPSPGGN